MAHEHQFAVLEAWRSELGGQHFLKDYSLLCEISSCRGVTTGLLRSAVEVTLC